MELCEAQNRTSVPFWQYCNLDRSMDFTQSVIVILCKNRVVQQ